MLAAWCITTLLSCNRSAATNTASRIDSLASAARCEISDTFASLYYRLEKLEKAVQEAAEEQRKRRIQARPSKPMPTDSVEGDPPAYRGYRANSEKEQ